MDYPNTDDPDFSSKYNHLAELEQYLGFPFCKSEVIDATACPIGIGALLCPCSTSMLRSLSDDTSDFSSCGHYAPHCPFNTSSLSQQISFMYTLIAPTSAASRLVDESITFLNQGQSYELKLKRISNNCNPIVLESVIRITFHERRLLYAEKEQFESWVINRKDEKMIEIDIPLLYNVIKSENIAEVPNAICIRWLAHEEATVGLKINCISTEFTAKKHGGEKGVPLRMQIETYAMDDRETSMSEELKCGKFKKLLHSAYCLVKIFKPNGADRKNKNDQLKIAKMTLEEKASYQPSYENTVFKDISLDVPNVSTNIFHDQSSDRICHSVRSFQKSSVPLLTPKTNNDCNDLIDHYSKHNDTDKITRVSEPIKLPVRRISNCYSSKLIPIHYEPQISHDPLQINPYRVTFPSQSCHNEISAVNITSYSMQLALTSTISETIEWLKKNNFDEFINQFKNFSGADLFRLSRNDLVEICGLADGIRLHNAIYSKKCMPKLTIFVQIRTESPLSKTLSTDSLECCSPTGVSSTVTSAALIHIPPQKQLSTRIPNAPIIYSSLKSAQSLPELKSDMEHNEGSKVVDTKRRKLDINNNLSIQHSIIFHPIYLNATNLSHLSEKLAHICQINQENILNIFHKDKLGIIVLINDDFIENIEDRSCYIVDVITEKARFNGFSLILQTADS